MVVTLSGQILSAIVPQTPTRSTNYGPGAPTIENLRRLQRNQRPSSRGGSSNTRRSSAVVMLNGGPTIENAKKLEEQAGKGLSAPSKIPVNVPDGFEVTPSGYIRQKQVTPWQRVGRTFASPITGEKIYLGTTGKDISAVKIPIAIAEVGSLAYGGMLIAGTAGTAATTTAATTAAGTAGKFGLGKLSSLGLGVIGFGLGTLFGGRGGTQDQNAAPQTDQNVSPVNQPTQDTNPNTNPTQDTSTGGSNESNITQDGQGNVIWYSSDNSRFTSSVQETYSYNYPTQYSINETYTTSYQPVGQEQTQSDNGLMWLAVGATAILLLNNKR